MKYYIARNGQPDGPFELEELSAQGLTPESLVWRQGLPEWVRAGDMPEFESVFSTEQQFPPVFDEIDYSRRMDLRRQWNQPASNPRLNNWENKYYGEPLRPNNYLAEAIVATILCFLPTGIIAIINASKVNNLFDSGSIEEAYARSKSARNWLIATIVLGIIVEIALFY